MRDLDELMTAAEVMNWLKVGRNFPYVQLRRLALRVGGSQEKPVLRWRRGDLLAYITANGRQES